MFVEYNIFMSSFRQKKVYQILLLVFLLGTFLRLYRLADFAIFLGDQGRDAIIMKNIVNFSHFPAVGPSSSVGQIYLGPFYYYFMAPWLAIFHLNPIGPIVGVALLSSLFIVLAFIMVADLFDEKIALLTSIFLAFSATIIDLSRFSWNPNILPMFSFIAIYFFCKSLFTKDRFFFIATGFFLGIAFQLHYVTFSLLFACVATGLVFAYKDKDKRQQFKNALFALLSFTIINIPLILFDLRHQFLNSKNFITLFTNPSGAGSTSLKSIIDGFISLNSYAFSITLHPIIAVIILAAFIYTFKKWHDVEYRLMASLFLISLVITSFMTEHKFAHYFGILYPMYYLLIAIVITRLFDRNNKKIPNIRQLLIGFFIVGMFVYSQAPRYSFLYKEPNKQIAHAEKTAAKIFPLITSSKFRLTAIPDTFGYSAYGYFLEVWGKKPVDNLTLDPADEMFVMCEGECAPIGNPQWDVAFFKANSVSTSISSDNVNVYKLIR